MRKLLFGLALLALPAIAFAQQDTSRCATVTVSRATAADIPALLADAECFAKALISAANSQALRIAKAKELANAEPTPTPSQSPTNPHDGHMPNPPPFTPLRVSDIRPIERMTDLSQLTRNPVPASAKPDVVGAFRFICNASHLSFDDAIAYPKMPGAAHLHMFFGNLWADANSTYASLRASAGGSSCQGDDFNKSAYWIPALYDGLGNVVLPEWIGLYYKRLPDGDPRCLIEGTGCVGIPTGLRAIFGTNYVLNHLQSPHVQFDCDVSSAKFTTLAAAFPACRDAKAIYARIHTPTCWNGFDLDSPDHQSHLAYQSRDAHTGRMSCPATHPKIIPEVTFTVAWSVQPGEDPSKWLFSSDIVANAPAGSTFHADIMEAWEPSVRALWEANCIGKLLNCSGADLGNGRGLPYPAGFTFAQRPRLVPIPAVGERVSLR